MNLTKEFVGWGVCWKLGEIFVGKRGIVEDFLECPRNVLLTTTAVTVCVIADFSNGRASFICLLCFVS